ncbi:hypothetical protein [Viridibacterium curvum]|uniref:hypothetical protein n=1 Tax=Viridibacterium curvum TaxID=1101404 RepID=UPI0031EC1C8B
MSTALARRLVRALDAKAQVLMGAFDAPTTFAQYWICLASPFMAMLTTKAIAVIHAFIGV